MTNDLAIPDELELTDRELLEEIRDSQLRTEALVTKFVEEIKPYLEQVTPMLEAIAESPIYRTITGKKRERKRG